MTTGSFYTARPAQETELKMMKTKNNPTLTALLKQAAHFLEDGKPCEAVDTLNKALAGKVSPDIQKRIRKAKDKADIGSPDASLVLIGMILMDLPKLSCVEAGRMGGQTGGKSTSKAKAEAARRNAKKGGRPRKDKSDPFGIKEQPCSSAGHLRAMK